MKPKQFFIAMILTALTIQCAFAQDVDADKEDPIKPKSPMLTQQVLVVDPDGKPVEDATVTPRGMRTKIERGSWWGWNKDYHGPQPEIKTGADGIAEVPYPQYVHEKLECGTLNYNVTHDDFVPFDSDRGVADDPAKIKLERGYRIAATAVHAETGEKIKTDLYAVASGYTPRQWKLHANGMLVSPVFAKKQSTLRILQVVDGVPKLYSESIEVEPDDKSRVLLKDVKLSSGVRVEGKLDDSVERPIKNGIVAATIKRKSKKSDDWASTWGWNSKATINEDGTFVFESLPPGEVLQMISICDGWVAAPPNQGEVLRFFPKETRARGMVTPQLIELKGEKVEPVIEMEKTTSVEVTVFDPSGEPLEGATVVMWPNQYWFDGGSQIVGDAYSTVEFLYKTRTEKFEYERTNRFKSKTDKNGVAVIPNLPADRTESLAVAHKKYEQPISGRGRQLRVNLKTDRIAKVTVKMQEKGTEVLNANNFPARQAPQVRISMPEALENFLNPLINIFKVLF